MHFVVRHEREEDAMKAILVRVGADQVYGRWNAPVDPRSGDFVYVPIPEKRRTEFKSGLKRSFREVIPALREFAVRFGVDLEHDLGFPPGLKDYEMHLDPDFDWLTYGDNGNVRGAEIKELNEGDLLVFYAGLRSVLASRRLLYALVGLYVVEDIVEARSIPAGRWRENAHTRKSKIGAPDIVVRAKPGVSGRLARCIPIGEYRAGAYRVTREHLSCWGGLSVSDGYIQRSIRPPSFSRPQKFYDWFQNQGVPLVQRNN